MDNKDYYKILGIDKKATQDEIKKAYRTLAVKLHPDKNPGNKEAEEKFKLANEANGVLSNPEKRKQYDELGENWQQHQQAGNARAENPFGSNSGAGFGQQSSRNGDASYDYSDLFEQFFASNSGRNQNQKGGDYETEMEITLEEAYHGTNRIIEVNHEKLRITTKAGSFDNQILKIKSKGANGSTDANRGDLYVRIKIKPHSAFIRKGDDLYHTATIDLYTAVLGGEIIADTLTGQVKVKITEGTQSDKTIRLKGKGMPVYEKTTFGDFYIQLKITIPDKLNDKQRELFEELKSIQA